MKSASICFILAAILSPFSSNSQRLRKSDRLISANIRLHVAALSAAEMEERKAGSNGEKLADQYLQKQFEKTGLKPKPSDNSWFQEFEIYDGKFSLPGSYFKIDEHPLTLYQDYFPFVFSAEKRAEGAVAIALAESGFPWFKDLDDIVNDEGSKGSDLSALIRDKAGKAAAKGATALIIFNSNSRDLAYDAIDRSATVSIPVLYLTKQASKKYCGEESATLDVDLNVSLEEKQRHSKNIITYSDYGADSTILISAALNSDTAVAALLEVARLSKNLKPKKQNLLFVIYSAENNGKQGSEYLHDHWPEKLRPVKATLKLDSTNSDALNLVKETIERIKKS